MTNLDMEYDDWADRWTTGRIGFHQSKVSRALTSHTDAFAIDGRFENVFVPLCGKSLDIAFLAELSDTVVGVEFVEQAVREFYEEHGLTAVVDVGPPCRYQAGNITLFAADFFALTPQLTGPIDAVFDRASLVALDRETRRRYADHLASLIPSGARILLVSFDYDQAEMTGPPFAVSAEEVADLYGGTFDITHLETRDVVNEIMAGRGLTAMTESNWILVRR
ncbi:MAG: thiopurine S-methyltransferase [Acidimicrobiales bacterium]